MTSVIVVGAGVVGTSIGLALLRRGHRVTVLERGHTMSEVPGESGAASWAAAGILGAQIAATSDGPLVRLCLESRARFPEWLATVDEASGQNVGLNRCGILRPAFDARTMDALASEVGWQKRAGLRVNLLDAVSAQALEPALDPGVVGAVRFPDDGHIDAPALLETLRGALHREGALRLNTPVRAISVKSGHVTGIELDTGEHLPADVVVVAAGSWAPLIGRACLAEFAIVPARGQMVELVVPAQILRGVVDGPRTYLSPRSDGRILVGSTVELVGYRLGATAEAVRDLLAQAISMVPESSTRPCGEHGLAFDRFQQTRCPLSGRRTSAG